MLFEIGMTHNGCNRTYDKLMAYDLHIIKQVKYIWEQVLNEDIPYDIVEKGFTAIPKLEEGAYHMYVQFKVLHS